jgi:hypothetical protein
MVVTVYDGTRQRSKGKDSLIRIFDGVQNQLFDNFNPAPTPVFNLPARQRIQSLAESSQMRTGNFGS